MKIGQKLTVLMILDTHNDVLIDFWQFLKFIFYHMLHNYGLSDCTCHSIVVSVWGLPLFTYAPRGRGGGQVSNTFHCVFHAKREEGVQIACKNAYVINGRPFLAILTLLTSMLPFYLVV